MELPSVCLRAHRDWRRTVTDPCVPRDETARARRVQRRTGASRGALADGQARRSRAAAPTAGATVAGAFPSTARSSRPAPARRAPPPRIPSRTRSMFGGRRPSDCKMRLSRPDGTTHVRAAARLQPSRDAEEMAVQVKSTITRTTPRQAGTESQMTTVDRNVLADWNGPSSGPQMQTENECERPAFNGAIRAGWGAPVTQSAGGGRRFNTDQPNSRTGRIADIVPICVYHIRTRTLLNYCFYWWAVRDSNPGPAD